MVAPMRSAAVRKLGSPITRSTAARIASGFALGRRRIPAPRVNDARGDVKLVAPHRYADERNAGGQCASHGAHAGVRDDDRRLGEQLGVWRAANHGCVARARSDAGSIAGPVVTRTRASSRPRPSIARARTCSWAMYVELRLTITSGRLSSSFQGERQSSTHGGSARVDPTYRRCGGWESP